MFELIPCFGQTRRLLAESLYDAGLFVGKELELGPYVTIFPESSPIHIVLNNGDVVLASPLVVVDMLISTPGSYAVVNNRNVFHPMMLALLFPAAFDRLMSFVSNSQYDYHVGKPPTPKKENP